MGGDSSSRSSKRRASMSIGSDFKEATFIVGKLVRILKRKAEIEVEDDETGEPSLMKVRLADDVNIDINTIGEDVKAVIVDGKVARITQLMGMVGGDRQRTE